MTVKHVKRRAKVIMRGSRKFCQRGYNGPTLMTFIFFFVFLFIVFFLIMRRGMIQIPIKAGHYRSASVPPFKWRFAGGPLIAQH